MSVRDRLLNAAWQEVTLPSGVRVRGVMPDFAYLVRKGLFTDQLLAEVAKLEAQPSDLGTDRTPEQRRILAQENLAEAAGFVREGLNEETGVWEPLELTPADLDGAGMNPRDVTALVDIILGRRTVAQVTADSLAAAGEISAADAERIQQQEAGATEAGWTGFRDDGSGEDAGGDSPAVPRPPVVDDRAAARPRRSRPGPGAGASPSAG